MRGKRWVAGMLAAVVLVGLAAVPTMAQVIKVGGQCDRTGPTKNVGVELCPGLTDYIALSTRRAA